MKTEYVVAFLLVAIVLALSTCNSASNVLPSHPVSEPSQQSSKPSESISEPIPEPEPGPGRPVNYNVKITKIFYDGLVPRSESDEYVEIKNIGSISVNLQGWILRDISEGYPSFTFPDYLVQPGKSIRVYTNEIHAEYGGFSFGYGKAVWNNKDPDTATLFNSFGQEVSIKSY